MTIDFYYAPHSPPCHLVQMAIAALGLEVKEINALELPEKLQDPGFLKLNPQHIIPTIKDGEFVLWESRAIIAYLMNKYGKDDSLYPKDPQKRALVDQRLHFDMGTLFQRFGDYYFPQVRANAAADPAKLVRLEESLAFLETFLEGSKYVAGEDLTIADFAVLATVSCLVNGPNYSIEKYPNIQRWFKNAKEVVPGYQKTQEGAAQLRSYFVKEN